MESLIFLLIAPVLWPFIAKAIWRSEITGKEIAANIAIGAVVVLVGWFGGRYAQTADTEVVNGEVLNKASHNVSCEHSYSCNCRESCSTNSQGHRSCSTTCETCYEHSYDVDWTLHTNVGDIDIHRVDRQGIFEPPRFSKARVGDPVAQTQQFTNYVKAAPDSLFNTLAEKSAFEQFKGTIPPYPSTIHDYHYINRVLVVGAKVPDVAQWNEKLAVHLKKLGPTKQVNTVIVFTGNSDSNYAAGLRAAWLGGKKNDVVLVMGVPNYPEIAWARVISWTDNQLFKVELSDSVQDVKTASPDAVLSVLSQAIAKGFVRKHMRDFEYLKWDIEPPTWLLVALFVLSLAASVGASVVFSRNNERVFGSYRYRR